LEENVAAHRRLAARLREKYGIQASASPDDADLILYTSNARVVDLAVRRGCGVSVRLPRMLLLASRLLGLPVEAGGVVAARRRGGCTETVDLGLLGGLAVLLEIAFYTELGYMARFALVGATGVLVNLAAWSLFVDVLGLHLVLSGKIAGYALPDALATEVATLWNFALNEAWTFADLKLSRDAWSVARRLVAYNAVSLAGLAVLTASHFAFMLLTPFSPRLSYLAAILVTFVWNYTLSRRLAWRGNVWR